MNLYMFYVGGNAGASNIEVHDIQFVAVEKPEQAWPFLRAAWFGDKDKIHLDGYMKITWADNHDVILSKEPYDGDKKLYFVNAGGYKSSTLAELHEFDLFVDENAEAAKCRALDKLLPGVDQKHKDNLKDIDNCLLLDRVGKYYLHLEPNPHGEAAKPDWQGYLSIGE